MKYQLNDLSSQLEQLGYGSQIQQTCKGRDFVLCNSEVSLEHQKQLRKQYKDNAQILLFSPRRDGKTSAIVMNLTQF